MLHVELDCPSVFLNTPDMLTISTSASAIHTLNARCGNPDRRDIGLRSTGFNIVSSFVLLLEVACLCESHTAGGIGDCKSVARRRMNRPAAAALRGKRPARTRAQRLPRRKRELISSGRRRAAVALLDLTANRVVLPAEADSGRPLNHYRD